MRWWQGLEVLLILPVLLHIKRHYFLFLDMYKYVKFQTGRFVLNKKIRDDVDTIWNNIAKVQLYKPLSSYNITFMPI